ncbi:MAG: phosphoribosyltransferase [Actinomycetota bacterium]
MSYVRWPDRRAAGVALADELSELRAAEPVVVGLPRGGVEVADEVARGLEAPLEIVVVRKVGAPDQPELGIGAVGSGGVVYINRPLVDRMGIPPDVLDRLVARTADEVEARHRRWIGDRTEPPLAGRTVIVVDDGLATGGTAKAAERVLRAHDPARLVLAIPVCPPESVEPLRELYDEVVVLATPRPFLAVGEHFDDFAQVGDEDVRTILDAAARRARSDG